jgi:hypothetical protein
MDALVRNVLPPDGSRDLRALGQQDHHELDRHQLSIRAGSIDFRLGSLCATLFQFGYLLILSKASLAAVLISSGPSAWTFRSAGMAALAAGPMAPSASAAAVRTAPSRSSSASIRALADFNRAIELKPDYTRALRERSEVHGKLGNQQQSDRDQQEAARLVKVGTR